MSTDPSEPKAAGAQPLQSLPTRRHAHTPAKPSPLAAPATNTPARVVTPRDAPAGLPISGRIISATCFLPYTLGFRPGGEWEVGNRRGSSALYDSIRRLQEGGWEEVMVGWAGEVEELNSKVHTEGEAERDSSTGMGMGGMVGLERLGRSKSYHIPPPVPAMSSGDRMTVEGVYGKEVDEEVRISKVDRETVERVLAGKGREQGYGDIVPVWLGDEGVGVPLTGVDRWRNYAERVIWPLFHYIIPQNVSPKEDASLEERSWWRDYLRFNVAFADAIMKVYRPGDIVWIHDYHLLMLPEILRQRAGKDIYIGLFVHAPWPTSEIFKVLSRRRSILTGMLASNMVGFQSETYKGHFISCCRRLLLKLSESPDEREKPTGVDAFGSHCAVEAIPIGIDAEKVLAAAEGPNVREKMETIKKFYKGMQIIVGRDRLDSVRGVVQKLRAFEVFLEKYPEFIGQVVLIQVTSPSSLSQSSTIAHQVAELVSHINGKYGSLHYSPVHHYPQYLAPDDYFALLRVADLGLITSVRDGMNTTSLEYVVCQKETHGPVILSEFTGTAESLTDAFTVNPTNTNGVADKIASCLTLTAAQKKQLQTKLYEYVTTNTVQAWNSLFLDKLLGELKNDQSNLLTPALDKGRLLDTYKNVEHDLGAGKAGERIFMFDYDGTLTPIVTDPDMAIPSDKVVRCIKKLAQQEGNQVWIISGRDQTFLEKWLGHIGDLGLSAEHGCFIRMPGSDKWTNLAETMDMSWQKVAIDVFSRYTEKTQGSFVERKNVAVTWHYRRADAKQGASQARECQAELARLMEESGYDVEVMTGKANLEVRPRFVNKGEIARKLVADAKVPPAMVYCTGDDTTDEDMFRALQQSGLPKERLFTVTVGPSSKATEAKYHLLEPEDVIESVGLLVGVVNPADLGITS